MLVCDQSRNQISCSMQDLHGMIDAAKYADLVLLMVDGGFGFEMETFEFLNLLQVQDVGFATVAPHDYNAVLVISFHSDA